MGHGQRASCPTGHSHVTPSVLCVYVRVWWYGCQCHADEGSLASSLGHCGLLFQVQSILGGECFPRAALMSSLVGQSHSLPIVHCGELALFPRTRPHLAEAKARWWLDSRAWSLGPMSVSLG